MAYADKKRSNLLAGRYGSVKEDADSDDELKPVYDPPTGMAYADVC
jgi:hypothetical protein